MQASCVQGYDGAVRGHKDPTEELTALCETLFNDRKENITEAKTAVEFWRTALVDSCKQSERRMRTLHRSSTQTTKGLQKEKQRGRNHSRNSGSIVSRPIGSTRRKCEQHVQEPSVDEGFTKAGAVLGA